jgi:hypothetical protein
VHGSEYSHLRGLGHVGQGQGDLLVAEAGIFADIHDFPVEGALAEMDVRQFGAAVGEHFLRPPHQPLGFFVDGPFQKRLEFAVAGMVVIKGQGGNVLAAGENYAVKPGGFDVAERLLIDNHVDGGADLGLDVVHDGHISASRALFFRFYSLGIQAAFHAPGRI